MDPLTAASIAAEILFHTADRRRMLAMGARMSGKLIMEN
jgi:hypothetical protein